MPRAGLGQRHAGINFLWRIGADMNDDLTIADRFNQDKRLIQ